jgi:hypothetical protein
LVAICITNGKHVIGGYHTLKNPNWAVSFISPESSAVVALGIPRRAPGGRKYRQSITKPTAFAA